MSGFIVNAAVSLFYTPYIVNKIGVSAYGVVPLIMSLFVFANWLSLAINWSVGRYITIAYVQGDRQNITKIYNTAFWMSLCVVGILVFGTIVSAPFIGTLLRLPAGTVEASATLLICGAITTGFSIVSGVTEVAFYCLNRFDYRALLQGGRGIGTVLLIVLLFSVAGPRLEWIGIGSVVVAVLGTMVAFYWSRLLIPDLMLSTSAFSLEWLKRMVGTNIWVLIDQLGTIMMLNLNLLLVNRLFGSSVSAEFALATQWEIMLKSVMTAATVFTPMYVILVARNDNEGLRSLSLRAARFVAAITAIGGGVIIGFAGPLSRVWLHRDTTLVAPMMIGLVLPVIINASTNPLYGIWQAKNFVKIPSFATVIAGVISISVSLICASFTTLGPWSIIVGSATAFTMRNLVFTLAYIGRLLNVSVLPYFRIMLTNIVGSSLVAILGHMLASKYHPDTWLSLFGLVIVSSALILPYFWFFVMNSGDKKRALTRLRKFTRKVPYEAHTHSTDGNTNSTRDL